MLNQNYFYHGLLRSYAALFSNLFNDIKVVRKKPNGEVAQEILLPIDYAQKSKIIRKINEDPTHAQKVAITLPRLSFEISDISYDQGRGIIPIKRNANRDPADADRMLANYAFVPHNITFQLNAYVKNADDGFQIAEQIFPFFTPDWSLKVRTIESMGYKDNIVIIYNGCSFTDDYEGAVDQRRAIIWTFQFTMRCRFYGPIKRSGLIKRVNVNLIVPEGELDPETLDDEVIPLEQLFITPGLTANGQPTTDPLETIPYSEIEPTDNYAYIETWKDVATGRVAVKGSYRNPQSTGVAVISTSPSLLEDQDFIPSLVQTISTTGSEVNIDLNDGGYVILTLNNDVNSLSFSNWPSGLVGRIVVEVRNTGNYTISSYANVLWISGSSPTVTLGAGKKDILMFHSADAGTIIYGSIVGLNYTT